jgi:hypothetical protein
VEDVHLRYCVDCGEEYLPHVTRCADCGGTLQDKLVGESEPEGAGEEGAPAVDAHGLPQGEYLFVVGGLTRETAEPAVALLSRAGIPVRVQAAGYGLSLSARQEDRPAVIALLVREGVMPAQPDPDTAVGADGGACPACATAMPAGAVECPECGLVLGSAGCSSCGAERSPDEDACQACGARFE